MADSAGKAMVYAVHRRMIDRGEIEGLKIFLDIELNANISGYGKFLDHNYSWILLSSPLLISEENRDRYMRTAVKYRLEHPFEMEWPEAPCDPPKEEVCEKNVIEFEKHYNLTLKKYSLNAHNENALDRTASRPPQP